MDIHESKVGDVVVLAPDGSLSTAPECQTLERKIAATFDAHNLKLVIDGSKIRQIGSGAVRVLLRMSRKLQTLGGGLILSGLSQKVRLALEISGFDNDFVILASSEEAVAQAAALKPREPLAAEESGGGKRAKTPAVPRPVPAAPPVHPLRAAVLRALSKGLAEPAWQPSTAGVAIASSRRGPILELLKR